MALIVCDLEVEITPNGFDEMTDWLLALASIGDPFCVEQSQVLMFPETYMLFDRERPDRDTDEPHQVWVWMNGPGRPHWEIRGTGAIRSLAD